MQVFDPQSSQHHCLVQSASLVLRLELQLGVAFSMPLGIRIVGPFALHGVFRAESTWKATWVAPLLAPKNLFRVHFLFLYSWPYSYILSSLCYKVPLHARFTRERYLRMFPSNSTKYINSFPKFWTSNFHNDFFFKVDRCLFY